MAIWIFTIYSITFFASMQLHFDYKKNKDAAIALVAHAGAAGARQLARHRRHLRRYPRRRQAPAAAQRRQMRMERRYVPRHFFSSSRKSAPRAEVSTV